jgi:hypothetical protein
MKSRVRAPQMNSDEPMVDADRSAVGQRAYYDFIRGLKAIQQLEVMLPSQCCAPCRSMRVHDARPRMSACRSDSTKLVL